jgi:hypothetical protein
MCSSEIGYRVKSTAKAETTFTPLGIFEKTTVQTKDCESRLARLLVKIQIA